MKIMLLFLGLMILISCNKETMDSRDIIIGQYKCTFEHYKWQLGDTALKVITEIDTLVISKKKKTEIEILPQQFALIPNSFSLNENWCYSWSSDGSNSLSFQFFPDKDSISYFVSSGGLGGGNVIRYNGNKILIK